MGGFLLSDNVDSQAFEPVMGHTSIQHSHARNVKKDMNVNHLRCPRHGIFGVCKFIGIPWHYLLRDT